MRITKTAIADVLIIEPNVFGDDRGFFFESYNKDDLKDATEINKVSPEQILPINSEEYVVAAKRPLNSRLDTSKLRADYDVFLPQWEYHVDQTVSEIVLSNTQ